MAIDIRHQVRVTHCAGLHQIHSAAQQVFERCLGAKKVLKAGRRVVREFDQKIHIAGDRVEITRPSSRAIYVQSADVKALEDGGDAYTAWGDGSVPGGF